MLQIPVKVDSDLTITVKRGSTRLSPGEALDIAETLIRLGTRRMIDEEAGLADHRTPASNSKVDTK